MNNQNKYHMRIVASKKIKCGDGIAIAYGDKLQTGGQ
jgi:hypothetical protein